MTAKKAKKSYPYVEATTVVETKVYASENDVWDVTGAWPRNDAVSIGAPCGEAEIIDKPTYLALRQALDAFFKIK